MEDWVSIKNIRAKNPMNSPETIQILKKNTFSQY